MPDHSPLLPDHSPFIMPTIPPQTNEFMNLNQAEKIAAIVAITQLFKYYGVSSKFLPIIAIGTGVILEYCENPSAKGILKGVILGAMTTGSYGVIKNSAETLMAKKTDSSESKASLPKNLNQLEHDDYRGV